MKTALFFNIPLKNDQTRPEEQARFQALNSQYCYVAPVAVFGSGAHVRLSDACSFLLLAQFWHVSLHVERPRRVRVVSCAALLDLGQPKQHRAIAKMAAALDVESIAGWTMSRSLPIIHSGSCLTQTLSSVSLATIFSIFLTVSLASCPDLG